jgi:hypothetical protein
MTESHYWKNAQQFVIREYCHTHVLLEVPRLGKSFAIIFSTSLICYLEGSLLYASLGDVLGLCTAAAQFSVSLSITKINQLPLVPSTQVPHNI